MALVQNMLLITSLLLLIILAYAAVSKARIPGTTALFVLIISTIIWTLGSFMETNSHTFQWMLFWRNIQQIGVFMTPISTLYFCISYTMSRKLLPFGRIAAVIQLFSLFLIFTDQHHHLMRSSIDIVKDSAYGNTLVVHSTLFGSMLVAFNFSLPLVYITLLFIFIKKITPELRRPIWLIMISILLSFLVTLLKSTVLEGMGIYLPMSVLYLPSIILFSIALFRGQFLALSPIARNKIFDVVDQGILVLNQNGTITDFNKRAIELLSIITSEQDIRIGAKISTILPEEYASLKNDENATAAWELNKYTSEGYLSLTRHTLEDYKGRPVGYVLVLTDITFLKERAETDPLTGVHNREGLNHAYFRLQERQKEEKFSISAFLIDLDRFKYINDTYGHFGGDCVLEDFVKTVSNVINREYHFGRLGGDEFVILLPGVIGTEALVVAQKLKDFIANHFVLYLEHEIHYTVSIGVSDSISTSCSLQHLLCSADSALYAAKKKGRNLVEYLP